MNVYVIHELDLTDSEEDIIGVADSIEDCKRMISQYYAGDSKSFDKILRNEVDVRDSGIEYYYFIATDDCIVKITIMSFFVNNI